MIKINKFLVTTATLFLLVIGAGAILAALSYNDGFEGSSAYHISQNTSIPLGSQDVGSNPDNFQTAWDRSSAQASLYLKIVNGPEDPDFNGWDSPSSGTIDVGPDAINHFLSWATLAYATNPAQLTFSIDENMAGGSFTAYTALDPPGLLQQVYDPLHPEGNMTEDQATGKLNLYTGNDFSPSGIGPGTDGSKVFAVPESGALTDGSKVVAVPEPGTMVLLAGGLLGLAAYERLRRKK